MEQLTINLTRVRENNETRNLQKVVRLAIEAPKASRENGVGNPTRQLTTAALGLGRSPPKLDLAQFLA